MSEKQLFVLSVNNQKQKISLHNISIDNHLILNSLKLGRGDIYTLPLHHEKNMFSDNNVEIGAEFPSIVERDVLRVNNHSYLFINQEVREILGPINPGLQRFWKVNNIYDLDLTAFNELGIGNNVFLYGKRGENISDIYNDGTLIKTHNGRSIQVIINGTRHPFRNGEVLSKRGYRIENTIAVSENEFNMIPQGETFWD